MFEKYNNRQDERNNQKQINTIGSISEIGKIVNKFWYKEEITDFTFGEIDINMVIFIFIETRIEILNEIIF